MNGRLPSGFTNSNFMKGRPKGMSFTVPGGQEVNSLWDVIVQWFSGVFSATFILNV